MEQIPLTHTYFLKVCPQVQQPSPVFLCYQGWAESVWVICSLVLLRERNHSYGPTKSCLCLSPKWFLTAYNIPLYLKSVGMLKSKHCNRVNGLYPALRILFRALFWGTPKGVSLYMQWGCTNLSAQRRYRPICTWLTGIIVSANQLEFTDKNLWFFIDFAQAIHPLFFMWLQF